MKDNRGKNRDANKDPITGEAGSHQVLAQSPAARQEQPRELQPEPRSELRAQDPSAPALALPLARSSVVWPGKAPPKD